MSSVAASPIPELTEPTPVAPSLRGRVGHLLARAHFLARDYADEVLAPFGLVIRQFAALSILEAEGPISQQALGGRLVCDRTTMVELMDDLERRGLTKRQRNPSDRRAYAIELSARGRQMLAEADKRLTAAEDVLFAPLSADERKQLRDLLLRLLVR
jgi:MarR family transcriptional regulator, lower aerobic nicotinate degradation pathway regulator